MVVSRQPGFSVNSFPPGLLVTWSISTCVFQPAHVLGEICCWDHASPPFVRKPDLPTAGPGCRDWPRPAVRSGHWLALGLDRNSPGLCVCGRHFPAASHGHFLNEPQLFLGSHLMFLGLVMFLFIMFHSGISQLCVKSKWYCRRVEKCGL